MEVLTLNKVAFSNKCIELISKLDFEPNLVVGILNGGGFVVDVFKTDDYFKSTKFELVEFGKKKGLKNNIIAEFVLKHLPYSVLNKLRIYESAKLKNTIKKIDINSLFDVQMDFASIENKLDNVSQILIVDDAIDSGKTAFVVKNNLKLLYPNAQIKIAVISWTLSESIIKPDYYIFKNILVRFPWSKDYKGK